MDSFTNESIAYATIDVSHNAVTTMSNEEGNFIFKIPAQSESDTIYISHIGYQSTYIVVHTSDTGFRIVKLRQKANMLSEVIVKTINPLELLKKAIEKIPDNYPTTPYLLKGFYRTTGRKGNNIIDFSEAVFDIYNENYTSKDKQLKVVKARLDKDLTAFGGSDDIYFGAKPRGIIENDIISNAGKEGLLSDEGINAHVFTYDGITDFNGRDAYKISYRQKDKVKKSLYDGTIYIDVNTLAFLQITQSKNKRGLRYWGFDLKQKIAFKLANTKANLLQDSGYTTYSRFGNKYYLSHVYGVSRWHIVGGRKYELNPLYLKFNLLISEVDTFDVSSFNKEDVLQNSKLLESKAPDTNTDSTDLFWGSYNLIQADYNVDSAANIIRTNNQTLNYKRTLENDLRKYKADTKMKIDSILSFYYHKNQFNGTALVSSKGKVIYEKGVGLASKEKNLPNTGHTQFRIGSTSKQFTAMLIMQLENEGKLSVYDTIGKYLQGYKNGMVTIQQLLTHQSGIPDYLENEDASMMLFEQSSTDELVKKFCSGSLEFEPGTQMNYSNSGYVILADIIEHITGEKYADVLQEKIFGPLGMTHSYFGKEGHDTSELATAYFYELPEKNYRVENEVGAGGITSTAGDLLKWNNALSANTLLPKEKIEEMLKPRVQWDEYGAYYGYGWMIDRFEFSVSKKHLIQYHPGTEGGFYDMLVRQPDKDIFIILLSNKSNFPRFDMTDLILNQLN